MTISILAYDEKSGTYGGAATTGSLCVGGWVLRGDGESGMSASQGSLPSTMWGSDVLDRMRAGTPADDAVAQITGADSGRAERQLSALDPAGGTGHFTGANSIATAGVRRARSVIVAGNLLASEAVLDACLDGFANATGALDNRLLAALTAAAQAGSCRRHCLWSDEGGRRSPCGWIMRPRRWRRWPSCTATPHPANMRTGSGMCRRWQTPSAPRLMSRDHSAMNRFITSASCASINLRAISIWLRITSRARSASPCRKASIRSTWWSRPCCQRSWLGAL